MMGSQGAPVWRLPPRVPARQPEVALRPSRDPATADLGCRWRRAAARRYVRTPLTLIARASPSLNDRNPWSRLLYQAVAKILVIVQRLGLGLVFDELALIAQPLDLSRFGVALVVVVTPPSKLYFARLAGVDAHAQLSRAGAGCDPAAPAGAMAVANGEHARRIAPAGVIRFERFENVPLSKIQTPLLNLNRSIRELRLGPQQAAKIGASDAQLGGGGAARCGPTKTHLDPAS